MVAAALDLCFPIFTPTTTTTTPTTPTTDTIRPFDGHDHAKGLLSACPPALRSLSGPRPGRPRAGTRRTIPSHLLLHHHYHHHHHRHHLRQHPIPRQHRPHHQRRIALSPPRCEEAPAALGEVEVQAPGPDQGSKRIDPDEMFVPALPMHPTNEKVNRILARCQEAVTKIFSRSCDPPLKPPSSRGRFQSVEDGTVMGLENKIFSNAYVDLGKIDVVGFDYDYTLVSYTTELQTTIYEMAKHKLVEGMRYPTNLVEFKYDPSFAIRGLAVDVENGWICQLNYASDVVLAYHGRQRVSEQELQKYYTGEAAIPPELRKKRLRPLNDLFSMVEACLLADIFDFFEDAGIPFNPRSVVEDVLKAVGSAHISGAMHRAVLEDMEKYIEYAPHLREILQRCRESGKKLWLVSNSQFWYVDGGMRHVVGDDWRELFEVVIVGASKPGFYTEKRPFREVSARTGRVKFKPIDQFEESGVYTHGSIQELLRITNSTGSKVLYLGDSLFADLVEARRLYGIATGAVISEVAEEMEKQTGSIMWRYARLTTHVLQHSFRLIQEEMGLARSKEDIELLDKLEAEVDRWQDIQEHVINANFGSIFRAENSISKFAHSMRRHADLYMSSVENLRFYSTEQRFYPDGGHESVPFKDPLLDYIVGDDDALA